MSLSSVFDFIWNAPLTALGLIVLSIVLLVVGIKNTNWWIRIICFVGMLFVLRHSALLLIDYGFTR